MLDFRRIRKCILGILVLLCIGIGTWFLSSFSKSQSVTSTIRWPHGDAMIIGPIIVVAYAENNYLCQENEYIFKVGFGEIESVSYSECKYFLDVVSDDFVIEISENNRFNTIGGVYTVEDFIIEDYSMNDYLNCKEVLCDELPQSFEVSLERKAIDKKYSGELVCEVLNNGSNDFGYYGTKVSLYYYGDDDIICFSGKSIDDAKIRFGAKKLLSVFE